MSEGFEGGTATQRQNPLSVLDGTIDHEVIQRFRRTAFSSTDEIERLRDWIDSPMSNGLRRGLAMWAVGRHADAIALLEPEKSNPGIAVCLARCYHSTGRIDEAVAVLTSRSSDPIQAAAYLHALERSLDRDRFAKGLDEVSSLLSAADAMYFKGRLKEFDGDTMGAIASYAQAKEVPAVRVVCCDAAAYDLGYMPAEHIAHRVTVQGRGGTVLQPAITLLESSPDFPKDGPLLVITDGACDRLDIRRSHAFLLPPGQRLPFSARGEVFEMS